MRITTLPTPGPRPLASVRQPVTTGVQPSSFEGESKEKLSGEGITAWFDGNREVSPKNEADFLLPVLGSSVEAMTCIGNDPYARESAAFET